MKIYIAEDEPLAAQKLMFFLQKLGIPVEDITHFDNGVVLIEHLKGNNCPDLLFLDIQMPGMTGLEVLTHLQDQNAGIDRLPKVIITSAYDQYAIDGFNFGVSDYLLKPYTLSRLQQALAKVRVEPTLSIRCDGRTERVKVSDIVCLLSNKDYTCVVLSDGRRLMTIATLSGFEQQLPPQSFARVQRSYVVALKHVKSYDSQSVLLDNGEEVPMSRTYRESFEIAMSNL